jgi:membrane protease YdiL (CAAX protease family)
VVTTFVALTLANAACSGWGAAGLATSELAGVLLPTVAWLAWRRPPRATLGLQDAPMLPSLGALIAGLGAFYLVAIALEPLMERVIPTPPQLKRALEELIVPPSGVRALPLDLLAFALVPAVAEELLFRGVLFGALRGKLPASWTVLVSAIAFAAYHGSLPHFLPALTGGLLLGAVRVASRRLAPAIAFHFANNAAVVIALRHGISTPAVAAAPLVAAVIAVAAGAWLFSCLSP